MQKGRWKSMALGLGAIVCLVSFLFAAVRLPVMEVVRSNIQSGIDADAYFYSDIEGFGLYEDAVAKKRRDRDCFSER